MPKLVINHKDNNSDIPISSHKKKLLVLSDAAFLSTGFGIVADNIIRGVSDMFDVLQIGINYNGEPYDSSKYPWQILPARTAKYPGDVYGYNQFFQALIDIKPDFILIINDIFTCNESFVEELRKIKHEYYNGFKLIYYYPVDCALQKQWLGILELADCAVAYSYFAKNKSEEIGFSPHKVIYHGVDTTNFFQVSPQVKQELRKMYFRIEDDDTFIWLNVNRNGLRKDLARTIMAFAEFKKNTHNNSILYLHTKVKDGQFNGGLDLDLSIAIRDCGLTISKDVFFPSAQVPGTEYNVVKGIPVDKLNHLYNCADGFITTTLGEGCGLCLKGDTVVYTDTSPTYLKDINIGDYVIGEDGEKYKVLNKSNRTVKDVFKIKSLYNEDITTSIEHKFLISKPNTSKLQWLTVEDINIGDYLLTPKIKTTSQPLPKYIDILDYLKELNDIQYDDQYIWCKMGFTPKTDGLSIQDIQNKFNISKRVAEDAKNYLLGKNISSRCKEGSQARYIANQLVGEKINNNINKINRYIPIDNEFLYFLGWYIAEGSNAGGKAIELDFHKKEYNIAKKLGEYLNRKFNTEYHIIIKDNKCRLMASGIVLSTLFGKLCGIHSENKQIPKFLTKSPKLLGPLLNGYFNGDGYLRDQTLAHKSIIAASSTSQILMYQIKRILLENNILSSVKYNKAAYELGNKKSWNVKLFGEMQHRFKQFTEINIELNNINNYKHKYKEDDNYFYLPVVNIIDIKNYNNTLYDIQVDKIECFIANGIIAHNCVYNALQVGLPTLVPYNTVHPELYLQGGQRAYLYPCKEKVFLESSGIRPMGRIEDIVNSMNTLYKERGTSEQQAMINRAKIWCNLNSWQNIRKQWRELFIEVDKQQKEPEYKAEVI